MTDSADLASFKTECRTAFANIRNDIQGAKSDVVQRQDRTNGRIDQHELRHAEQMRLISEQSRLLAGLAATVEQLDKRMDAWQRSYGTVKPQDIKQDVEQLLQVLLKQDEFAPVLTIGEVRKASAAIKALYVTLLAFAGFALWVFANWPKP